MALFNISVWQRSRFTLQWLIINLVGSLAYLTAVALAQFDWSEGVSGSVTIPDVAFTCLGNLAVFMTAFTRGRLDVENGARDVLATTRGPKLNVLKNGRGLSTLHPNDLRYVDVVLLSKYNERPCSSLTQFMQYISHSHNLDSILLQFLPFISAPVTAEICECGDCQCIVFWATEEIMVMLARRLPGTLKGLSKSQCLLPSLSCLKNGCHGCNQGLLYVEDLPDVEAAELGTLREDNPRVDSPAAVCEALNKLIEEEESSCICIPVHPRNADRWTKFMIKFLKSKEKEAKGIKVMASDALQNYTTHSSREELGLSFRTITGSIIVNEIYENASLILPRVAEVIVNILLTVWLKVDGFSSSLVARRSIRDYVVDSAGTGFAANAFLTQALVIGSAEGTNACQVLFFRGGILSARRVSYMVGCVNLICSIPWSLLIACKGNWATSMPISTPRGGVIAGAVVVSLFMDGFEFVSAAIWVFFRAGDRAEDRVEVRVRANNLERLRHLLRTRARPRAQDQAEAQAWAQARDQVFTLGGDRARLWGLVAVGILDVGYFVTLALRMAAFEEGVYSGMQVLVWVKWGIGSFLLGDNPTEDEDGILHLRIRKRGTWVYCSAFLLNAMLAVVRGMWVCSI